MPRVAIVVIGNEILSGKVEESNARYAIGRLRALGADLERICVVPDAIDAIAREVRESSAAHDYLITSGGVGPTHDDITYEAMAAAFGEPLIEHPGVVGLLRKFYGEQLSADHLRMARFPRSAVVRMREDHPFPVVSVANVFVFPGIPFLFQAAFDEVAPAFAGPPFHLREVFCMRDEGVIASALRGIQDSFPDLALGSYPRRAAAGGFEVRITIEGRDAGRVNQAASQVEAAVLDHG